MIIALFATISKYVFAKTIPIYFKDYILISGELLSFSNFILFFVLYETLTYSRFRVLEQQKEILETLGAEKLSEALTNLIDCLENNNNIKLLQSIVTIINIGNKIGDQESEIPIKAYESKINTVKSLLQRYKIKDYSPQYNIKKLSDLNKKTRGMIISDLMDLKIDIDNLI